jgi:hypothetical protein
MLRLIACLVAASLIALVNHELHAQADPAGDKIDFNIPAQPLARALLAYGAVTGMEIFYNASLAGEQRSQRVVGAMTPEAALRMLLSGTAYIARSTGPGTFTITQAPRETASASAGVVSRRQFEPYFAALQRGISDALCRHTAPAATGGEQVVQFWMSPSGVVERADVLADNGDRANDQSLATPLRGLALAAPPAGVPQPINMVIFPLLPGASTCGDHHKGRRASVFAP